MSNTNNNMVQIPYDQVLKRTASAVLFQFGDQQEWIPRSLIAEYTGILEPPEEAYTVGTPHEQHDEGGDIEVPEWIAIEKGLDGIAEPVE